MERVEGQGDRARIEIGGSDTYDLALGGCASGFGIDPVGGDGGLRPHHHDDFGVVQRAGDVGAEPVAAAQPGLVPPDRAFAVLRLNGGHQFARQVGVPHRVADEDFMHAHNPRSTAGRVARILGADYSEIEKQGLACRRTRETGAGSCLAAMLRDASLRDAPQHEVRNLWIGPPG